MAREIGTEIGTVSGTDVANQVQNQQTGNETFFKTAQGGYKWLNISGAVVAAVAVGFGIKFFIKKFTK